jgi:hypothetical protein
MIQKLSASALFLIFFCAFSMAQEWSKEDSIWLRKVLEGNEEIEINEETKKAIEDGRLIAPSRLRNNDNELNRELMRDFDNAGKPDSIRIRGFDPYSMPPAVYALYVLYLEKLDSIFHIESVMLSPEERKKLEALLPTGTLQSLYSRTNDYTPGGGITTDFNHLLSMIFSSRYRQIHRNNKNAQAYKNYFNNGVTKKPFSFTEHERKQLNQSVNGHRTVFKISTGPRRSGIDD